MGSSKEYDSHLDRYMQRSWQDSVSAADSLSKIFSVRSSLGVPWTLQFASPVFVGIGPALIVGWDGFEVIVGVGDAFAGPLVEVAKVVVVMPGVSVWRLGTFGLYV